MATDDEFTKLLLHCDGDNNGTVFIDEAGKIVTPNGNACTKTTIKKFGTASGYFNNDSKLEITNGDFILRLER